jgi:hypothetical protein
MFCPRCASNQSDDLKFCTVCGANLAAVKQAVAEREPRDKFDWNKTWVTEMFLTAEEKKIRKAKLELERGITPEIKRYTEIKAGVILSSLGVALMIFLFVFMQALIASGKVSPEAAEILASLWVAGVIPLFLGAALVINGVVVSNKLVQAMKKDSQLQPESLPAEANPPQLGSAEASGFTAVPFSVTEQATKQFRESGKK